MKKKLVIILSVLVIFGFGIYVGRGPSNLKNITKIPSSSSSMIAMYIQDEEGNYNLSNAQEFPKDGYVLNTEKSNCKNGGVITQNASTKALSLKVKTSDECSVFFDVETLKVGESARTILAKANDAGITTYNNGNKKEMFVFDHPEAEQTTGWTEEERRDYRYIGNEPNNYITFNDETWKIIGVFTVEIENGNKEQLIKIIRNDYIGVGMWNNPAFTGINEWSSASSQILLNEDYYNQSGSYTSTASVKGLSTIARAQIAKAKWYLGGPNTMSNLNGSDYYNFERSTRTCITENVTECNNQTRTTSIMQNVGLMYPSDYLYTFSNGVNNTCYSNGQNCQTSKGGTPSLSWLFKGDYQWTQTPYAGNHNSAVYIYKDGYISYDCTIGRYFRPALYLNSSVKITGGDGSEGNPYTLSE